MRVHHLNCATLCPLGGKHVGEGSGGLLRRSRMVCRCLLIEAPAGLVLVDTGLGSHDIARPDRLGAGFRALLRPRLDPAETALQQLRSLGFRPDDVRDIVLTHLDADHAGGLADFPQATVHLYDEEYRVVASPSLAERVRYRPEQWSHGVSWWPHRLTPGGEPWFGFACVRQPERLPPEVLLVPLVGHTRGHCGVAVQTPDGWLLHAGDAYFSRRELRGEASPAFEVFARLDAIDDAPRRRNRERLRHLALHHAAEVSLVCSHDGSETPALPP